jgi:hypothetical protein
VPSLGHVRKQLICAHCDAVIATAGYRRLLSWGLDVTSPAGQQLTPVAGSVQLRVAQRELAATAPAGREQAQRRVDFIRGQLHDVIYDLPCPRGHRTLVTEPQITRAMRRAKGSWVFLGDAVDR